MYTSLSRSWLLHRRGVQHRLPVARRVLDRAGARRRRRPRLRLERSQRHLRRRLPGHDAVHAPREPRRADRVRGAAVRRADRADQPAAQPDRAGRLAAAARGAGDPRQLLPQAVHRLRRRDAGAGAGAGAARPRLGGQPAARRRRGRARPARRSPRSASSRSRWRCSSASSPAPPSAASTTTSWCGSAASSTRTSTSSTTSELLVTSERDLFASGLLPTRTPGAGASRRRHRSAADLRRPGSHRRLRLSASRRRRSASAAATAILTVPLALRQREIEREIADLDRAVLLGALMLILLGAGLGYWMAERIGDPVQRLTRATRRIAAGDLEHPRHRADRRRAAAPRRGVQPHGRRAAAPAQPGRAHAPPRGVGRDGAAGRARHQEPADADPALGRAPAARAPRSRRAAVAGPRHLRRHDPHAGAAAAADRLGVLELRLVADRAADGDRRSPICCAKSSIPTSSASGDRVAIALDVAPDLPPVLGRSDAAVARASSTSSRTRCTRCRAAAR